MIAKTTKHNIFFIIISLTDMFVSTEMGPNDIKKRMVFVLLLTEEKND